jgi:hypothetical protein
VQFLKEKSDTVQKVTNYLAYMDTQKKKPKGIQIDRGTEFVNDTINNLTNVPLALVPSALFSSLLQEISKIYSVFQHCQGPSAPGSVR